jgi:membrane-associated protein
MTGMDVASLLESFGYVIIFISVFIECGVLLGLVLPLPGFSLLFTAGVFAVSDQMSLTTIILVGTSAAVIGYIAGYYTGAKYGRKFFYEKETKKYFTPAQGKATERFMKKYGYSTLIVSRFLPVMHSVAPLMSGVARTPLLPFMIANVLGGALWVIMATLMGYFIGQSVPGAQYYIIPFFILSVIIANTPLARRLIDRFAKKVGEL